MAEAYISINFSDLPRITVRKAAFATGVRCYKDYAEKELLEMLQHGEFQQVYEALGAIGKGKLKSALPHLQTIALYDEDIETQEDAIRTIRRIGGRKALDILRFLKTTEHKELIDEIMKSGAD